MIFYFMSILIVILAAFWTLPTAIKVLFTGYSVTKTINLGKESIFNNINFVIDPLSAFFIIIILIMGILGLIYSKGYLKPYIEKGKSINSHYLFYTALILSMLGVVTCQNALFFLVIWEIMSLSSFFLCIFENEEKEVLNAGIKYLIFMHISVLFLIIPFAILSIKTGGYNFESFSLVLKNNEALADIIFILFFVGFGIKAGFVPFHNWLPEAHPIAPSHISAIMSGVMIKTGIYGILRILMLSGGVTKFIAYFVLIIAVISALYGILYAVGQSDIKKMLAYSSIENIGIIGIGIGVGMLGLVYNHPMVAFLGFIGAIFHILNHSIFKNLLFFGAGAVYLKSHTKNMELLGGLIKKMPKTGILFLTGCIAICALPPFNGFIGEFLIYFGILKGLSINSFFNFLILIFAFAGLALVGTMALLCFTKAFSITFLGHQRSKYAENVKDESPHSIIMPMGILAVFALSVGLFPGFMFEVLITPVELLTNGLNEIQSVEEPLNILQIVSLVSAVLIILTALLAAVRYKLNKKIESAPTWGCGYDKELKRAQYTGSSYVSPFLSMLKPLFKKVYDVEKPKKLFPKSAHFSMKIEDIEEAYVINPLLKFDEWFLSKFEKLQNGNLQTYLKYGLIFLLISIIGGLLI